MLFCQSLTGPSAPEEGWKLPQKHGRWKGTSVGPAALTSDLRLASEARGAHESRHFAGREAAIEALEKRDLLILGRVGHNRVRQVLHVHWNARGSPWAPMEMNTPGAPSGEVNRLKL